MPEMPHAGERHGDPGRVGGGDDVGVAHRAAGLDHRCRARLDRRDEPVGEGEEGVGGDDRTLRAGRRQPGGARGVGRLRAAIIAESTRDICPAPTPTVTPSRA